MWHMEGGEDSVKKNQVPSPYSLGVKVEWWFGEKGWVNKLIIEWMN